MNWLAIQLQRWGCPHQCMRRVGGPRAGGRHELGTTATWRCCDCGEEITKPMEWNPPAELLMPGQQGESVVRECGADEWFRYAHRPGRRSDFMWDEVEPEGTEYHTMDPAKYAAMHKQVQQQLREATEPKRDRVLKALYKRGGEHWNYTL